MACTMANSYTMMQLKNDLSSLSQLFEFAGHRAWLELVVLSKGQLACCLSGHTAKDHAIQQRVAAQTIVAMDATSCFTRHIQTWDDLATLVDALSIHSAFQTAHGVVNDRGDDGHIKGLGRNLGSIDDVVEELLAAACLATGFIPGLARRIGREWTAIRILLLLLCGLEMLLVGVHQGLQRHTHVLGQVLSTWIELHDSTASVVLGMPDDFISCCPVEAKAEWWLVLPHFARDVVTTSQLIAEAVAIGA
mmetsp:Transcript_10524/g.11589  ORF Transcript_10524/g.11589 Transcript_10524/m.11589 type:complete len:249 (+) Transcript_10524:135-881(+)